MCVTWFMCVWHDSCVWHEAFSMCDMTDSIYCNQWVICESCVCDMSHESYECDMNHLVCVTWLIQTTAIKSQWMHDAIQRHRGIKHTVHWELIAVVWISHVTHTKWFMSHSYDSRLMSHTYDSQMHHAIQRHKTHNSLKIDCSSLHQSCHTY